MKRFWKNPPQKKALVLKKITFWSIGSSRWYFRLYFMPRFFASSTETKASRWLERRAGHTFWTEKVTFLKKKTQKDSFFKQKSALWSIGSSISRKSIFLKKLAKKCVQKLQKLPFLAKKASFWTKNTCKIETNGPRDLKLGSK